MTHTWTELPNGACPVQGRFLLSDGRIGYYRSRGGETSVELWAAGTEWPESGLPRPEGEWHDISEYADGVPGTPLAAGEWGVSGDPDYDEGMADEIVRRWLAAGGVK